MPDIAMCFGSGQAGGKSTNLVECPKKETCYRFKATPSEFRQTYFANIPYDQATDKCKHFLPLHKQEVIERELP